MLLILGRLALVLGVFAMIAGAIILLNAKDEIPGPNFSIREAWNPIKIAVGLNMLSGGLLTALLGAIGVGVADAIALLQGEVTKRTEVEEAARRRESVERYAITLAPIYKRLAEVHGPVVAETAVKLLAEAKVAGRHMTEEMALTQAKAGDALGLPSSGLSASAIDALRSRAG